MTELFSALGKNTSKNGRWEIIRAGFQIVVFSSWQLAFALLTVPSKIERPKQEGSEYYSINEHVLI